MQLGASFKMRATCDFCKELMTEEETPYLYGRICMSFPIVCTRCNYGCYTVGEELGGPGWVELSKQPKNEENTAKWEAFLKEKYAEFAAERKKKKDEQRALKKKPPR